MLPHMRCVHNLAKNGYLCKLCWDMGVRGKGVCIHRKHRHRCSFPECRALRIKIKNSKREKLQCVPVDPDDNTCPHGKGRMGYYCVQCYDDSLLNPNPKKSAGMGICVHRKRFAHCQVCKPGAICEHGFANKGYLCLQCFDQGTHGKGICRHRKQMHQCPSMVCKHFTPRKLGVSLTAAETFLQAKIDSWNAKTFDDLTLESCDLVYIKPLTHFTSSEGFHITNIQPLPKRANGGSQTWTDADEEFWRTHISHNMHYNDVYVPI